MKTHKSKPSQAVIRGLRMEKAALLRLVNLETLETMEIEEIDLQNFPLPWQDSLSEDNKDYFH